MAKQPQDHLSKLRSKKPITTTLYIPLADGLEEKVSDAKEELGRARILQDAERETAALVSLAAVEEDLRENSLRFYFEGMGRVGFEELLREHEPTPAQKTEDENAAWNPDTFPAAIISACLKDPKLSEQEVKDEILDADNWGPNEVRLILDASIEVNTRRRVASLGN